MAQSIAYGIFQKHRSGNELTGVVNGPFGFLYDKSEAQKVAMRLYGEDGFVQPTNPDHFAAWGYGKGSETSPASFGRTMVGSEIVDLLWGEHPHSRSDNRMYARFSDGRIEGFSGHSLLHSIFFQDVNYLKESELSGDEVRKGGACTIMINGFPCAKFSYREITWALLEAHKCLAKFEAFPIQLWDEKERSGIVGRKVYYNNHPAVIRYFFEEDLDIVLLADPGPFPLCAYEQEDMKEGMDIDRDDSNSVKDSIFSPHIWWYRS